MAKKKFSPVLPLVLAFILVVGLASGYIWINREKYFPKTEQRQVAEGKWLRDGDAYSTVWEYVTGGGNKGSVGFTVSLTGDVIKTADVEILTTNATSLQFQTAFEKALPNAVVGKKLSDIADIDIVGGASGTTEQFKAAIAALETQLGY